MFYQAGSIFEIERKRERERSERKKDRKRKQEKQRMYLPYWKSIICWQNI